MAECQLNLNSCMKIQDLLNVPIPTVAELSLKYQVSEKQVHAALQKGIQVEQEHTTHPSVARQIALAHLAERLDYYDQLAKVDEATTRTSKVGAPGTLKAKISGPVTCEKVKRLKQRSNATPHDVRQANWFINMHDCAESVQLSEIFKEPARHLTWQSYGSGEAQFWETGFRFDNKHVVIEMHPDVRQISAKYVFSRNNLELPTHLKGWVTIFRVDNSTDITGGLGTQASKLLVQVVRVIRGFLQTHAWDYVLFSGEEGSRDRLYQDLSQRLADQMGARTLKYRSDFVIYKHHMQEDAAGVGLVVPGVNMPAGIHADEIRRQARKWGFKVSKHGVPPITRSDGKY
jgi:hypothetical protein